MDLIYLWICIFSVKELHAREVNETVKATDRNGKLIFSVIRFPNAPCVGSGGFNGTCYTASECSAKGGSSSVTCASGFGVCCVFSMACGSTISQNNTYHIITSFTAATTPSPCTYTICPCNNNICKLRLDFESFSIAGPETTTSNTAPATVGPAIGDCKTDSFTVTSPEGGSAPPTICGLNTGQHMFVDSSSSCNKLSFNIDKASSTTRSWRVKVTQYDCGSDVPGIVDDCLQYVTGTSGIIKNFNYDSTKTNGALATANTHLSNQNYEICFRQERGFCSICFSPVTTSSFSVSASADAGIAQSAVGSQCSGTNGAFGDYIEVNNLAVVPVTPTTLGEQRMCGNFFNAIQGQTTPATLCSAHVPFRWGVRFDDGETTAITLTPGTPGTPGTPPTPPTPGSFNTAENFPLGGMTGFEMNWFQVAC